MSLQLNDPSLLRQQAYVNGQWCEADSGARTEILNPANGEPIGSVPNMGRAETRRAIEAAQVAQPAWRALTAKERANRLRQWFNLIMANQDDLARIMTAEQGKPLAEARGEIAYAASFIEWFAEEAKRAYGDMIPGHAPDKRILVQKEPVGVTAAITPWNFPSAMITRKAGPALAVGCAMVLKPAPQTPFSALALAALAERAGIPAGLLSVIPADVDASREVGGELCDNPIVRKLSFTGSTGVGIKLMQQCAPTLKKLSLELGGNAPFIVFDDADLDAAVAGAMASKFRNNGQTCVCANRIYVQAGVYDAFAAKLAAAVNKLNVGDGLKAGITTGPLINMDAVEKVQEHISDVVSGGGKVLTGGKTHSPRTIKKDSTDIINNMLSIIIDPASMGGTEMFEDEVENFITWVKSAKPQPGVPEVLTPGEPERARRVDREKNGVPIDATTWQQLVDTARKVRLNDIDIPQMAGA